MPTLIRFIVFIAFLAGLGFAGMLALTFFVDPGEKEITVRIPARDLQVNAEGRQNQISVPRPLVNSEPEPTPVPDTQAPGNTAPAQPIAPGADQDVPE